MPTTTWQSFIPSVIKEFSVSHPIVAAELNMEVQLYSKDSDPWTSSTVFPSHILYVFWKAGQSVHIIQWSLLQSVPLFLCPSAVLIILEVYLMGTSRIHLLFQKNELPLYKAIAWETHDFQTMQTTLYQMLCLSKILLAFWYQEKFLCQ